MPRKQISPITTARGTKDKIAEKAKTPLGPSSIFDELYKEGAGVIEKEAESMVCRGIPKLNTKGQSYESSTAKMHWKN